MRQGPLGPVFFWALCCIWVDIYYNRGVNLLNKGDNHVVRNCFPAAV